MDYRDPDWLADKLGLDKNTVYRFLQDGTIPAIQLGRKWLVSEKNLLEWLEQETQKQTRTRREAAGSTQSLVQRLDNFTAAARQALKLAHSEARRYAHDQLDQGHLLLGFAIEGKSAAAQALTRLGITIDQIRSALESRLKPGHHPVPRRLSRTPQAKRSMRLAARLARKTDQPPNPDNPSPLPLIGSDHLLTGILLSRTGLAHDLLHHHAITRRRLIQTLREVAAKSDRSTVHSTKEN